MSNHSDRIYELIQIINPLYRGVFQAVEANLQGTSTTVAMRAVLEVLKACGPSATTTIAEITGIASCLDPSTDALVKQELVKVAPDPKQPGVQVLTITEAGEREFARIHEKEKANLAKIGENISADDVSACLRVLQTLNQAFTPAPVKKAS